MQILVVDDSRAMRSIVIRAVKAAGIEASFHEAQNGAEALAATRRLKPDLVLSDWNMPEMSGIDLLQALRAEGIQVPFGFVTSEGEAAQRDRAREAGALFLIAKPFSPDAVKEALAALPG